MSRSSTPDTQIWRPASSDNSPPTRPLDRPLHFLPRREKLQRRPSTDSYSTVGSFTLDDVGGRNVQRVSKNPGDNQTTPARLPHSSVLRNPARRRSSDSFSLEDSIDLEPAKVSLSESQQQQHGDDRRESTESFQTTGSFALDESVARRWEIEHGWQFVQETKPTRQGRPEPPKSAARNFSRPLRPMTEAPRPPDPVPMPYRQENSATSSSDNTFRSSVASDSGSSSSSSASSVILRVEDYPGYAARKAQEQLPIPPPAAEKQAPKPSLSPTEPQRHDNRAPSLVSRSSYPPNSAVRPSQPSTKQVSFEHSRAPPPSLQDYPIHPPRPSTSSTTSSGNPTRPSTSSTIASVNPPRPSTSSTIASVNPPRPSTSSTISSGNPTRPSTSSTTASHRSLDGSPVAQSTHTVNTVGSGGSASVGSGSSMSTQALVEAHKASNFDISSLPPKQLEKLKKKGIDPALWLEMRAATAKSSTDQAKKPKKGGLLRLGGRPLVGNAFIG